MPYELFSGVKESVFTVSDLTNVRLTVINDIVALVYGKNNENNRKETKEKNL